MAARMAFANKNYFVFVHHSYEHKWQEGLISCIRDSGQWTSAVCDPVKIFFFWKNTHEQREREREGGEVGGGGGIVREQQNNKSNRLSVILMKPLRKVLCLLLKPSDRINDLWAGFDSNKFLAQALIKMRDYNL